MKIIRQLKVGATNPRQDRYKINIIVIWNVAIGFLARTHVHRPSSLDTIKGSLFFVQLLDGDIYKSDEPARTEERQSGWMSRFRAHILIRV